ncbi:MAG: D-glycero-beta-D-manno-heptose 1,7-bisphosphate 7-phosphatase [Gammaproteobacteria bacterium]|nr:D-glycero-beta-D-manno-heptose 1,7-bisphosphate 7-phosphatase [Gammaproteobacteria bacterium]MBA3731228.1 D-glycero-beta-D-manno-heptose 1,7-bisphosphate 7-phosphatase [Gammaproteobacteria bacterium]
MRVIILDRDGVINYDHPAYIKSPEEWRPIHGSLGAIARFTRGGYRVMIASNQSGLGRGLFDVPALDAIHNEMRARLASLGGRIDAIFYCPHLPSDGCNCRKPEPGLFWQIAALPGVNLMDALAVGDSLRDLQAAASAGVETVLVRTGNGAHTESMGGVPAGVRVFDDLAGVADHYLPRAN